MTADITKRPPVLYKYLPFEDEGYFSEMLLNGTVKFSSPTSFNDPFDCRVSMTLEGSDHEILNFLRHSQQEIGIEVSQTGLQVSLKTLRNPQKLDFLLDFLMETMQQRVNNLGVFCLTEKRDDVLMWSHYADKHTGVCLGYSKFPEETYDVGNDPLAVDDLWMAPGKVSYAETLPDMNIVRHHRTLFERTVLTKAISWSYEKEWRMMALTGGPGIKILSPPTEIVIGARMPESNVRTLLSWMEDASPRPKIFRSRIKRHAFGVDIAPLDPS